MSRPPWMPAAASIVAYHDAVEAAVREQVAAEIETLPTNRHQTYLKGFDCISRDYVLAVIRGGGQS